MSILGAWHTRVLSFGSDSRCMRSSQRAAALLNQARFLAAPISIISAAFRCLRPDRHESARRFRLRDRRAPYFAGDSRGFVKSVLSQLAHAWMPATGEAVEANLPPLRPKATPPTSTPTTCWPTIWCFAQVRIIQLVSVGTVGESSQPSSSH